MAPSLNRTQMAELPPTEPVTMASYRGQAGTPGEGPYIVLSFEVLGDTIVQSSWESNGCPSSIACANAVAQIVRRRTVDQARRLTAHDIEVLVGGLPEGKGYCAEMAVEALQQALKEAP